MSELRRYSGNNPEPISGEHLAPGPAPGERHERQHRPLDIDLESVPYVPLPPSPTSWDLAPQPQRVSPAREVREVVEAGAQGKYTKVITLSKTVSARDLAGPAGEIVARAYRHMIQARIRAGQQIPAARWAQEMLERVPQHCSDTDRKRFNSILDGLDKAGVAHTFARPRVAPRKREAIFTLVSSSPWTLQGPSALPMKERPDPALKLLSFTSDGVVYADFSGRSTLARSGQGVIVKRNRRSELVAVSHITHDAYRIGAGPAQAGVAIMDSHGVLHLYREDLSPTTITNLAADPRVLDHFRSTETNYWGEFRTQVRAVDISADGASYLFTLADEAWCCDPSGGTIWGVRMPLNEGWERVVGRRGQSVLSADVEAAMKVLGLALPFEPRDVGKAWRSLARQHHPDFNPGDDDAVRRMQVLNEAYEKLTGVDPTTMSMSVEDTDVTFFRQTRPTSVTAIGGIRVEMWGLGKPPQDWIYRAAFASAGSGAFLATYSGKVVKVDRNGAPQRIYDLGTVPTDIVESGEYLYFLTPTRLYVLRDRVRLVAFLDVFRQGRLFVTPSGLGLLDAKSFKWFSPAGQAIGEVATRDPIRAIYDSAEGCVVETRQHRAVIVGLRLGGVQAE